MTMTNTSLREPPHDFRIWYTKQLRGIELTLLFIVLGGAFFSLQGEWLVKLLASYPDLAGMIAATIIGFMGIVWVICAVIAVPALAVVSTLGRTERSLLASWARVLKAQDTPR